MIERWVCLLYHDVPAERGATSSDGHWFDVPYRSFEQHLDLIRDCGYHGCSLSAALGTPTERQVAISFDDGNLGQFVRAFPALVARGMTATFFVTTSLVGKAGYVTWTQLREMKSAGMSIQSHTRTHAFLSELGEEALREELLVSRQELDDALEQHTDMLALPGGDFPPGRLRRMFGESGYAVVATSQWGRNGGAMPLGRAPLYLRRCTVRGTPKADGMERIFAGDPWLAGRRRLREVLLGAMRRGLGPSRYARWRRQLLDKLL